MREVQDLGEWGHWFAGFFAGEGFLVIATDGRGAHAERRGARLTVRCAAGIKLRRDDEPVLLEVQAMLGMGRVRRYPAHGSGNANPEARWGIGSKADCLQLVRVFDRFPLRAKKRSDFEIWREAVLLWAAQPPRHVSRGLLRRGATRHGTRDWDALRDLQARLAVNRAYHEPPAAEGPERLVDSGQESGVQQLW